MRYNDPCRQQWPDRTTHITAQLENGLSQARLSLVNGYSSVRVSAIMVIVSSTAYTGRIWNESSARKSSSHLDEDSVSRSTFFALFRTVRFIPLICRGSG